MKDKLNVVDRAIGVLGTEIGRLEPMLPRRIECWGTKRSVLKEKNRQLNALKATRVALALDMDKAVTKCVINWPEFYIDGGDDICKVLDDHDRGRGVVMPILVDRDNGGGYLEIGDYGEVDRVDTAPTHEGVYVEYTKGGWKHFPSATYLFLDSLSDPSEMLLAKAVLAEYVKRHPEAASLK